MQILEKGSAHWRWWKREEGREEETYTPRYSLREKCHAIVSYFP